MERAGLDQWLLSFAYLRGAFNMSEETLAEGTKRRELHCIEEIIKATEEQ
jgi:hypothetical protein